MHKQLTLRQLRDSKFGIIQAVYIIQGWMCHVEKNPLKGCK